MPITTQLSIGFVERFNFNSSRAYFLCHAHFYISFPLATNIFYFRVVTLFLDGKKYEDICPSTHNMECPIVKRTEYQLIDIDDEGFCSLMDDTGETRDDLKPLEPELEKQIREKVDAGEDALVCVLKVCFISNIPKRLLIEFDPTFEIIISMT